MHPREVEVDLEELPSSSDIVETCEGVLDPEVLQEIYDMQLDPADTLGCLWAELLAVNANPEEFFRRKGIIQ